MDIGSTIREIRKRKKITITQICDYTGLSKGFMSNIENNKTAPSISTLETIANSLNVPLAYLLLEKEKRVHVVRKGERKISYFGKDQIKVEHLTDNTPLQLSIIEVPPGYSSLDTPHAHQGVECHLVLKGQVFVKQGEDELLLEEGDTFYWNACVPHAVQNLSNETALLLVSVYNE
jgi:transcriptional regulator with XRE-family HTH domain